MLKEQAAAIEAVNVAEREAEMRAKQATRAVVVGARAGVAVAAERLAIERRAAAEEERKKQVGLPHTWCDQDAEADMCSHYDELALILHSALLVIYGSGCTQYCPYDAACDAR